MAIEIEKANNGYIITTDDEGVYVATGILSACDVVKNILADEIKTIEGSNLGRETD